MNAQIERIDFGIFSSDEIKKMAVCKLENSKLVGPGTIYDPKMGCTENNVICPTCKQTNKYCTGHFAYINLQIPIIHPLCYKIIIKWLKCICYRCSQPLIDKDTLDLLKLSDYKGKMRFMKILENISQYKICKYCSTIQPKYIFNTHEENIYMVSTTSKNHIKTQLQEYEIYKIFENIPDENIHLFGLNPKLIHPKNLIITILPVLPSVSRPYVKTQGHICDDDLTILYCEIIKTNNHLYNKNLSETKRQKYIHTLKFRIKCLFDNSKDKARHTNGRPMKCIKSRLCGKEGQIRGNLMGKRVNRSARTVIGPDPNLKLGEILIPNEFAEILTYPINVNKYNYDKLSILVNNNKANYVIKKDNTRINLKYALFKKGTQLLYDDEIHRNGQILIVKENNSLNLIEGDRLKRDDKFLTNIIYPQKKKYVLEIGDIVERKLCDGDIALLNRQPTLHKQSIMAKIIRLNKHNNIKTIRMNLATTKPYNADFDGDEMNLHIPSNPEAEVEMRFLAATQHNIISAQNSKPIIAIVQDALLGAYKMTYYNKRIPKGRFFKITMAINYEIDILRKLKYIRNILKKQDKSKNVFNGRGLISLILPKTLIYDTKNLKIYKGVIISGAMNKSILGTSHHSLLKILYHEYSPTIAVRFINNIQFIANAWLKYYGFSIGIKDCIATKESEIRTVITRCFVEAKGIEETTFNPMIREIKVSAALNKARDHGMKIAKDALGSFNNFVTTVTSGSKGDFFNIAQITGLLGQQNLTGKRIQPVLNRNMRTLPHYAFNINEKEVEFESRGFIKHNFKRGLNPREFFFHAITGREGITDTSGKTATTGYIQRKMVKRSEDIKIHYDTTVRNSANAIIQFQYGSNNLDPISSVQVNGIPQACNISRLVDKINIQYKKTNKKKRLLNQKEIEDILTIVEINKAIPLDISLNVNNKIKSDFHAQLVKIKIFPELITNLKEQLKQKYEKSAISPGECVGVLMAQSIGESNTQSTLNTFHHAGAVSNIVLGVSRFVELLNGTKNPKAKICHVYFKTQNDSIKNLRSHIGHSIIQLTLKDLCETTEIFENKENASWYKYYEIMHDYIPKSKYIIRYKLNQKLRYTYNLTLKIIADKITNEFLDLYCIYSPESLGLIDIFVDTIDITLPEDRILFITKENAPLIYMEEVIIDNLNKLLICGICGIKNIFFKLEPDNLKNWMVITEGSNLIELLKHPKIDSVQTTSNDMWEIYKIFGIEAVREFLIEEFENVVTADGTYINICHIKLLVDIMTFNGTIQSISRYGSKMEDVGPIAKASFEENLHNFFQAALYGISDQMNGVSASIAYGKKSLIGTGMCDLKIDFNKLLKIKIEH